ncbi:MAG TPA: arylsulfatase [Verrucomicrobiae bacterium]|nr:arylsulfatase [Verrucomicrobiae bacterium]
MSYPTRVLLSAWLSGVVLHSASAAVREAEPGRSSPPPARPNVVIILADDLGYGDVRCFNPGRGKIPTPHIDRLAGQGMRFMDGHSSSGVCSPSRYALLTGRYHWRSRLQTGIVDYLERPLIAPDRLTIAELAKQHGYRTAAIGKWHLGWDWDIPEEQREFFAPSQKPGPPVTDELRQAWKMVYSGPIAGGPTTRGFEEYFGTDVPNWPPYCFIENDRTVGLPTEFLPKENFQNALASKPGPAVGGWKLDRILPALGDRACEFIARQAKAGRPFLLYMPLTSPHTPIAVAPEWQGKSGLNIYGDFVMETDAVVGRVMGALDECGVADRTLVIFTSDNGPAYRIGPVGAIEKLGHFSSGPLRGHKGSVWEGGHRVPFVVRWPGVVRPGGVCGQLVHQADIMATLAHIFGARLPDAAGVDSFSLLPLLMGEDRPVRPHAVSCAGHGEPSVRSGAWKFIPSAGPQLYHLVEDIGETRNLAAEQPARVAEMRALLEKLIIDGRSTPGAPQANDVDVRRYPVGRPAPGGKQ